MRFYGRLPRYSHKTRTSGLSIQSPSSLLYGAGGLAQPLVHREMVGTDLCHYLAPAREVINSHQPMDMERIS